MTKFKEGDIVEHVLLNGRFEVKYDLSRHDTSNHKLYIEHIGNLYFDEYGFSGFFHKPSVKLVERPKKFEEREIEVLGNVYEKEIIFHKTLELAKQHESITEECLNPTNKKVTIKYLVEVENE